MHKDQPYMYPVQKALKGFRKKFGFNDTNNVRHRCTCPVCGAKLVKLYFSDGKWQCSKCKKLEEKQC